MKIFTTINPYGNFESQNESLLSWSKYYEVFSVNPKDEIEIAKDKFPYVKFIETDNIFIYGKKKLVKLNAILKSMKEIDSKKFAIVNSDIILKRDIPTKFLTADLTIGTRWELDDVNKPYPFNNGYDLFIFNKDIIDFFINENYVIGMPWWDFWIPLIAIKLQLSVNHIKNEIIYHRTHQTNYDADIWIKFGEYLYKDIIINLMKRKIDVDVYTFCTVVKKFIESKQKNIKIK
jgi:hypothetical protein